MRIIADKAVASWQDHSLRGTDTWHAIRKCAYELGQERFVRLGRAATNTYANGEANVQLLEGVGMPCLFVVGSEDGTLPEEMETYPTHMKVDIAKKFVKIEHAGRFPWWEAETQRTGFVKALMDWFIETTSSQRS